MDTDNRIFAQPFIAPAEPSPTQRLAVYDKAIDRHLHDEDRRAAEVLIRSLFSPGKRIIDGLEYHVAYALAEGAVGGDIVDVYHFDNGNVALSIADISGKGVEAAVHAALVKYGLRCYASDGLTAERVLRSLDRAYIENNAFERTESFASVFFGIVDQGRRMLSYANAGHEPVFLCRPGRPIEVLTPTAPLIGVFEDQHHLFQQRQVQVEPGTVLVAATDGVTEARNSDGELFGMNRLLGSLKKSLVSATSMEDIVRNILDDVDAFTTRRLHDDIAVLAARVF